MDDTNALKLLHKAALESCAAGAATLLVNAQFEPELFKRFKISCYQPFKTAYDALPSGTASAGEERIDTAADAEHVFILAPQQHVQTQYLLGRTLKHAGTRTKSVLIAAGNDAGGKRLAKLADETGLPFIEQIKFKSRLIALDVSSGVTPNPVIDTWIAAGQMRQSAHGFYTRPGIFGWDKIDVGSKLLIETINHPLKGRVADLGAGYGYLSHAVLQSDIHQVAELACFDADRTALDCCRKNLAGFSVPVSYEWSDLGAPPPRATLQGLDAVLMNPPFHQGQKGVPTLGRAFIRQAAARLRKNGILWMVANAHLPYEDTLRESFRHIENIVQKHGFKVIRAVK